ncbi:MAG TPA: DUF4012 domain-containing protein [Ktedonobacterales bacterium]|nr:DUF4012 domain-containing protein [Ktedonobacterales bacterium]
MSNNSATPRPTPWVVARPGAATRPLKTRRVSPWQAWVIAALLIALSVGVAAGAVGAGLTFRDLQVSITAAQAHLVRAEALGAQLAKDPFNNALLMQTRDEITAAAQEFHRASADADRFAPAQITPKVGLKVQDGRALLGMAVVLSDGGLQALDAAIPVLAGLKAALTPQTGGASSQVSPQASSPLTTAQLIALRQAMTAFAADVAQAGALRQQIPDQGAALGASATHLLAKYDQLAPTLSASVDSLGALLAAAPSLLGTDHPASFLVEILDETELRGGGGFIGNYGIVTVTGGRMAKVSVKDTYLLDGPYLAHHSRAFPASYRWFPLAGSMGLRDSNLSPDFPANAQLAENIYHQESGQSVNGVIAFNPAFISQLLQLTGPIAVPGYPGTVTSQNLVQTIHHYQFQTNAQGVPSSDGVSSTRKRFTALLGETVFARVRALPAGAYNMLLKMVQTSLQSKDVQLYLNDQSAETLLTHLRLANTLPSATPSNDTLALVDNNVGANKANLYVTQAASDTVTLGPDGSAQHTLRLVYVYRPAGSVFGDSPTFADEVQIYVPQGSKLGGSSGLSGVDAPSTQANATVFGGKFAMAPFTTHTVILRWTTPATHMQAYHLVVDRQAGSLYTFSITIHLPASTSDAQATSPLTLSAGQARYTTTGPLTTDLHLDMAWR